MLSVPCGISGKVRIVKKNSETGEITHDSEFNNTWTNSGLASITKYASQNCPKPGYLAWGSGKHLTNHQNVTTLAAVEGIGGISFIPAPSRKVSTLGNTIVLTETVDVTVPAKGKSWVLRELGLVSSGYTTSSYTCATYTLTKNGQGVPEDIPVSDIEILTIYYTVQIQYPLELTMPLVVEGLPPTTATLKLNPLAHYFGGRTWGQQASSTGDVQLRGINPTGSDSPKYSGNSLVYGIDRANRSITHLKKSGNLSVEFEWEFFPPIVKNNTQVLHLDILWKFTNIAPIDTTP